LTEIVIHNHVAPVFSDLERQMIEYIPEGGNWQGIPSGLSARVDQIRRRSEERGLVHTTYYGRLAWDSPSYTISTFFNRIGNGCFLHPEQQRLITPREAARLQSFPDRFQFIGPSREVNKQVGNAVPPLLGAAIGSVIPGESVVDLFCGAGGLSYGLEMIGKTVVLGVDANRHAATTFAHNHPSATTSSAELGSLTSLEALVTQIKEAGDCDIIVGGPPCQSFSTAGLRSSDERSNHVFTFAEAVTRVRPNAFVMENVLGLRSFRGGAILRKAGDMLAKAGYDVRLWDLLAEAYGVPQRRRRLLLVGVRSRAPAPPPPLVEVVGRRYDKCVTVRKAIEDLPALAAGGGESPMVAVLPNSTNPYQAWLRGEIPLSNFLAGYAPNQHGVQMELVP
jgi:DNA (cytosine-5)-methyltransferase 1